MRRPRVLSGKIGRVCPSCCTSKRDIPIYGLCPHAFMSPNAIILFKKPARQK